MSLLLLLLSFDIDATSGAPALIFEARQNSQKSASVVTHIYALECYSLA